MAKGIGGVKVKNVNEMLQELRESDMVYMSLGYTSWCESFQGIDRISACFITSEISTFQNEHSKLLLVDSDEGIFEDNIIFAYSLMQEILRTRKQQMEIETLKKEAEKLNNINSTIQNNRVEKMLKLALNKACSVGELRNSVALVVNIFNSLGVEV